MCRSPGARITATAKCFTSASGTTNRCGPTRSIKRCLLGAIKWILNLEPGDATPNPELSKAQEEKAKADDAAARAGK